MRHNQRHEFVANLAMLKSALPVQPGCEPVACGNCGIYNLCVPLGLDQADMSLLESVVKRKETYKRGSTLFNPGEQADYVYAIRGGSVKTSVGTEDGRVQITGFYIAGELLGLSAMGSGTYSSKAIALETTSVCKVEIDRFEELCREMPALQFQMLKIMGNHIRLDEELMLLLGKRTAEERLAYYLLSLSQRNTRCNYSATHLRLSMSRQDIGSFLGIAEETVCRILKRFDEDGLIAISHRNVLLKDLVRLGSLARSNTPR